MKKYYLLFTFTFVTTLLLLMSSCAGGMVTKRKHRKGYHVEMAFGHRDTKKVLEEKSGEEQQKSEVVGIDSTQSITSIMALAPSNRVFQEVKQIQVKKAEVKSYKFNTVHLSAATPTELGEPRNVKALNSITKAEKNSKSDEPLHSKKKRTGLIICSILLLLACVALTGFVGWFILPGLIEWGIIPLGLSNIYWLVQAIATVISAILMFVTIDYASTATKKNPKEKGKRAILVQLFTLAVPVVLFVLMIAAVLLQLFTLGGAFN